VKTLTDEQKKQLTRRSVFFFDRDGTLTLGGKALTGAKEALLALKKSGKHVFVLTNNSSKTPKEHLNSLVKAGFKLEIKNVLVSTDVAAKKLKELKFKRVWWMASDKVSKHLVKTWGLKFDAKKPEAVLLTYDDTLDYQKLTLAAEFLKSGARYFSTHPDVLCPTPNGMVPDVGCVIEYLKCATGRTPEIIFGKPNIAMVEQVLKDLGKKLSDAVIVGDRIYTDIALAKGTDMLSVLVLTGETDLDTYDAQETKASVVLETLKNFA
jgi:4-nitrophenyl phosphatase